MSLSRNKLYGFILSACTAGYVWLFFTVNTAHESERATSVCLLKNATSLPCPSCGTTRSILQIGTGNLQDAFLTNPLGFFALLFLVVCPFWIVWDLIKGRNTFQKTYFIFEKKTQKPQYAIPLLLIIAINWVWNIYKEL